MEIQALNASARKVHGADLTFMVARSIAWSHDDNLVIVHGKKHDAAAQDFAMVVRRMGKTPTITQSTTTCYMTGEKSTHSLIQWN